MQAKEEELLSTKAAVFSLSFRPKVASFRPAEMKDEDENGNNQSMRTTTKMVQIESLCRWMGYPVLSHTLASTHVAGRLYDTKSYAACH